MFKSENQTIKFKGNQKFIQQVIFLLDGDKTLEQIFDLLSGNYKREDINQCINLLVQHNLIEEGDKTAFYNANFDLSHAIQNSRVSPQIEFFKDLGINLQVVLNKIKQSKIVIFGLGAHGALLAIALANEGIGHIKCLDPSLVSNEDLYLCSTVYQKKHIGKRREDALLEYFQNTMPSVKLEVSNLQTTTEKDVEKWINDGGICDFAVCCIDKGFLSIYYWLNKIALRTSSSRPLRWCAASIEGIQGTLGPTIIPDETACYMCYKMGTAAAEKSFPDAMSYYEYLYNNKKDELYRRSNIGISAGIVGNFVAAEVIKALLGFTSSPLAGKICVINFLNMTSKFHKILRRPDCPHCGFKKNNFIVDTKQQQFLDISGELASSKEEKKEKDFNLVQFFHENSKRNFFYTVDGPNIDTKLPSFKEYPNSIKRIQLPKIATSTTDILEAKIIDRTILDRRSCRVFVYNPISLEVLSKILYFGYGITGRVNSDNLERFTRPCPSAGALYPLEIYPIVFNVSEIEAGIYHYSAIDHSLELLKSGQYTDQLIRLFMNQSFIANSSICIILSAVIERTTWKYGPRGYRYLLLEAGHLAQNICLVATSEGLNTLTLGAFNDNSLAHFIDLDSAHEPIIYGLVIGHGRE